MRCHPACCMFLTVVTFPEMAPIPSPEIAPPFVKSTVRFPVLASGPSVSKSVPLVITAELRLTPELLLIVKFLNVVAPVIVWAEEP